MLPPLDCDETVGVLQGLLGTYVSVALLRPSDGTMIASMGGVLGRAEPTVSADPETLEARFHDTSLTWIVGELPGNSGDPRPTVSTFSFGPDNFALALFDPPVNGFRRLEIRRLDDLHVHVMPLSRKLGDGGSQPAS